jgi:hypothetical protein
MGVVAVGAAVGVVVVEHPAAPASTAPATTNPHIFRIARA